MKRSRFSEEQIIGILKEHQAGLGRRNCVASTGSAMRRSKILANVFHSAKQVRYVIEPVAPFCLLRRRE